jgi:hypothetical protein
MKTINTASPSPVWAGKNFEDISRMPSVNSKSICRTLMVTTRRENDDPAKRVLRIWLRLCCRNHHVANLNNLAVVPAHLFRPQLVLA